MQAKELNNDISLKLKITRQQELFCQEFVNTGSRALAYQKAYNASVTDGRASSAAHSVLQRPDMTIRIMQIRAQHAGNYDITRELLTENLLFIMLAAREKGSLEQLRKCTMDIAKLHGMIVEQQDINAKHHFNKMDGVTIDGHALTFDIGNVIEVEGSGAQVAERVCDVKKPFSNSPPPPSYNNNK